MAGEPTTPGGNGPLPAPKSWADDYPRLDAPLDNPVRADSAGMGDEFVVKLKKPSDPGALTQFLSRAGTWVNFASTELNAWGSIIGDIQNQADLWAELQARPLTVDFDPLAFSGQWNDIHNKPLFGDVSLINTNGLTSYFLRGDGTWAIPQDVFAEWGQINGDINAQTDLIAMFATKADATNAILQGNPRRPNGPPQDDNSDSVITSGWFFGQAFDGLPVMDGAASSGDSLRWARGNHRHPTDDTRAPLDSPVFTGLPSAPTPPVGNDTTRLATTAFVLAQIAATPANVPEAPTDGRYYVRSNNAWVAIDLGTRWDNDGLMDGPSFDAGFSDGFGA